MKSLILTACLLFLFSCNNSGSNNSNGGGDEGPNAGDVYAQEVQVQIQHVVNKTIDMRTAFPEINMEQLEALSQTVKIYYRDKTFVNGFETDAINDGKSYIAINKTRWARILNPEKKNVILLHEMLGILGLEKDQYMISSRLQPEFRFARTKRYKCFETPTEIRDQQDCEIDFVYDYDRKGFVIRNQSCRYFYGNNQFFFRTGNAIYSNDGCRVEDVLPEENNPVMSCGSTQRPDRTMWTGLTFGREGRDFTFTAASNIGQIRLECRGWL